MLEQAQSTCKMAGVLNIFNNILNFFYIHYSLSPTSRLRRPQLWIDLQNRLQAALTSIKRPQTRYQAAQEATSSVYSSIGYWIADLDQRTLHPASFCRVKSVSSSKGSSPSFHIGFFVLKHLEFSDYVFANE